MLETRASELWHSGACVVTIFQFEGKFKNPIFEGSTVATGSVLYKAVLKNFAIFTGKHLC